MQDDLREAVARAICDPLVWAAPSDGSINDMLKQVAFEKADAAIAAARPVIEREASQYAAAVLHDLSEAKREISALRDVVVTYGDRMRMAMDAIPAMQQAIDRAFDWDN
jgi:predicted secreted protein